MGCKLKGGTIGATAGIASHIPGDSADVAWAWSHSCAITPVMVFPIAELHKDEPTDSSEAAHATPALVSWGRAK
jgi:hypothetical protein